MRRVQRPVYGRHMPTPIPSDAPLRDLLEHSRLTHRDRRLDHVLGALRSRADAYDRTPHSLLHAIAEFSRERASVTRRLREIESRVGEDWD